MFLQYTIVLRRHRGTSNALTGNTNTFLRFISAAAWQIVLPLSPLAVLQYVWVVLSLFVCTGRLWATFCTRFCLCSLLVFVCVSVSNLLGVFFFLNQSNTQLVKDKRTKVCCGSLQENTFQTILQKVNFSFWWYTTLSLSIHIPWLSCLGRLLWTFIL